ncbi:MAG: hypothetical protein AB7P14_05060 [Blastocatellales bacterium]
MISSEDNSEWPLEPIDKLGRPIEVGDWVRLVEVPPSVATMPQETRDIFRRALGKTFKIYEFDEWGMAWLNLSKKVERSHTIGVEPAYLLLTRRMRKRP